MENPMKIHDLVVKKTIFASTPIYIIAIRSSLAPWMMLCTFKRSSKKTLCSKYDTLAKAMFGPMACCGFQKPRWSGHIRIIPTPWGASSWEVSLTKQGSWLKGGIQTLYFSRLDAEVSWFFPHRSDTWVCLLRTVAPQNLNLRMSFG